MSSLTSIAWRPARRRRLSQSTSAPAGRAAVQRAADRRAQYVADRRPPTAPTAAGVGLGGPAVRQIDGPAQLVSALLSSGAMRERLERRRWPQITRPVIGITVTDASRDA
jgi:hypothetical protein